MAILTYPGIDSLVSKCGDSLLKGRPVAAAGGRRPHNPSPPQCARHASDSDSTSTAPLGCLALPARERRSDFNLGSPHRWDGRADEAHHHSECDTQANDDRWHSQSGNNL